MFLLNKPLDDTTEKLFVRYNKCVFFLDLFLENSLGCFLGFFQSFPEYFAENFHPKNVPHHYEINQSLY